MKRILTFLLLLFCSFISRGQNICDLASLPIESKDELMKFWGNFNNAIEQNDTTKLISLCNFPFYVSQELITNNPLDKGNNYKIDSNNLKKYLYLFFFESKFKIAVKSCDEPTKCLIFHGNYHSKKKTCGYLFCYILDNNSDRKVERCISIVKFNKTYKLTSLWWKH